MLKNSNLELLISELKSIRARLKHLPHRILSQRGKDISIAADKEVNQKLKNWLEIHSDYPILSEEDRSQTNFLEHNDYLWIIDPLDGSLNYSRSIPIACISLALWKKKKPVVGVVYDINLGELFVAVLGKTEFSKQLGVWLNSRPINVSKIDEKENAVICTGFPSGRKYSSKSLLDFIKRIKEWKKVRLLGSAALSLAWVGSGRADAYIEEDIRIWDVAAGLAIVKAAGGEIELQIKKKKNVVDVKASNGKIPLKEI
jgi:myo-inositol-1(or 4)-monophosphatase